MTIEFSATNATTIAIGTVNATSVTILDSNDDVVEGVFAQGTTSSASPTVTFTPASGTPAKVVVSAGVKDVYNVAVTPSIVTVA
jgi:hypothetical protein